MTTSTTGLLQRRVMSFPAPLPSEQWVKDRLLWANSIGSLCPDGQLPVSGVDEEKFAKELDVLPFYRRCMLPDDKYAGMVRDLRTALAEDAQRQQLWEQSLAEFEALAELEDAREPDDAAEEVGPGNYLFVYNRKFPQPGAAKLVTLGVFTAREDGDYQFTNDAQAEVLFSVGAQYARASGLPDEQVLPEAQTRAALKSAASAAGVPDVAVALPEGLKADASKPLGAFVDFRDIPKNERMRQDYLHTLQQAMDDARGNETKRLNDRVTADLEAASASFLKRCRSADLANASMGTLGVILPVAHPSTPTLIAGGILAGAALMRPVLGKLAPGGPGYLRAVNKAGLRSTT